MLRRMISKLICAFVVVCAGTPIYLVAEGRFAPQSQSNEQAAADLLIVLQDQQIRQHEPERLIRAIARLGEMQSEAAIPFLIQLLTFSRTFSWENKKVEVDIVDTEHPVDITGRYPAAGALFMIGKPSLPALVKAIEEQESGTVASENALYTVRQIFRDAPSEGIEYLKKAAAEASMTSAAQRLFYAAHKLKGSIQK